jgi:predicted transcriptional regulator
MELQSFIKVLDNPRRQKIVQLLAGKDMSASEIFKQLGDLAPKYRQSVNKSLDALEMVGLVKKYYSSKDKSLLYHLLKKSYSINFRVLVVA